MWWSRARLQPSGLNSPHRRSPCPPATAQVSLRGPSPHPLTAPAVYPELFFLSPFPLTFSFTSSLPAPPFTLSSFPFPSTFPPCTPFLCISSVLTSLEGDNCCYFLFTGRARNVRWLSPAFGHLQKSLNLPLFFPPSISFRSSNSFRDLYSLSLFQLQA